jgi:hypothetical protein
MLLFNPVFMILQSPRRNCCSVVSTPDGDQSTMSVDVGVCREGEFSQI